MIKFSAQLISLVLVVGAFSSGQAQSAEIEVPRVHHEPSVRHSIGINTLGLLDQVFKDESESKYQSPYLITYTAETGKLALRAAIGPEYRSESTVHEGFTDRTEENFTRIDARVGAGMKILDERRWQAIAGVDAAISWARDRMIDDSGFDRITRQIESRGFGGGPFIRVAFHLSRRVSLAAESTIYWMHDETEEVELYKNFPDFNTVLSETTSDGLEITLPNTIFLRLHF